MALNYLLPLENFFKNEVYNIALALFETEELPEDVSTEAVEINLTASNKEEVFTQAPDQVKEAIKLRDEFPFLNEKDCPEEMYVLVGKKFNHYHAYVAAAETLLVNIEDVNNPETAIALTPEEVNALALESVKDFEVNQEIYAELTHYKEHGKILGKHPIFVERKLKESIDALTVEKATKRIANLDNYIRRDKSNAEKATKDADIEKYTQKVKEWEIELRLIKAKFGFSEE